MTEADRQRLPPLKYEFLAMLWGLAMAGVIPADGDFRNWAPKQVRQDELGASLGVNRSTFTRILSRMSNGHGKRRSCGAAVEMLRRVRQQGRPNRYTLGSALPAAASRPSRTDANVYTYPAVGDLCAHPVTGCLFSDGSGRAGYKIIAGWIFDPRLPVSLISRLVMTYYAMCGMLETGECHAKQASIAHAVGISVRAVRRANAEWAAIGLIRVAHPPPIIHPDGRIERGPQIVVYLPMRTLDSETAAAEAKRLLACRKRLLGQYAHFWDGICAIHGAKLREWAGREHLITAFWRAVRQDLAAGGVPSAAIAAVIPFRSD